MTPSVKYARNRPTFNALLEMMSLWIPRRKQIWPYRAIDPLCPLGEDEAQQEERLGRIFVRRLQITAGIGVRVDSESAV